MLFYTDKAHAKHMRDPGIRKSRRAVGWLLGVVWCSYYCWYPPPILFPTLLQFRWITQGCPGICSWLGPLMAWLACLPSYVISTIHWQHLTWIFWVTLKINLWRDNSVVLVNKMHTDIVGQNTTLLLWVKILSAKFPGCMFQPPEGATLKRDNKKYVQE